MVTFSSRTTSVYALAYTILSTFLFVPATGLPTETTSTLSRRYIQGLVAPLGYNYAWSVNDARLTMVAGAASAYTYMSRFTLDSTSCTITQAHVAKCTLQCDTTLNCAMAHVVLFNNGTNTEGNVVCALYNHPTDAYWATNRNDGDNSMGIVQSSYEFDKILDNWIWNPVVGTMCSEGSQTGFSLNAHQGSTDVIVNFEDGGICFDYASCYQQGKAYNIGTSYNETTFINQNIAKKMADYFITSRTNTDNPFNTASYAWIPYCTGDLHSGNSSVVYSPNTQETHHRGAVNSQLILQAIKAALPNTKRVWITGSSAGGFGAILQYLQATTVFGSSIRVDLIADSSEAYGNTFFYPTLKLVLPSSSACPKCNNSNFDSFLPGLIAAKPNSRFAGLSFVSDTVLPSYENVTQVNMDAEVKQLFKTINANKNSKTFLMPGSGHVTVDNPSIAASNNVTLATFFQNMKNDSTTWTAGM